MADVYSIKQSRLTGAHPTLGAFELDGFADGEAITFAFTDPSADASQGADGRSVAFDTQKSMAELEVNFFSTSPANITLTTLYNLNKVLFGTGNFTMSYTKGSTGAQYVSTTCFVTQPADDSDDNSAVPERSWTIKMLDVIVK